MSPLPNPRHEAFAQAIAAGKSAIEAYEAAGYKPHYANASRLSGNDKILSRVSELQGEASEKVAELQAQTAKRVAMSTEEMIERMRKETAASIAVLAQIRDDPEAPPAARVAAANSMLDRAFGKPTGDDRNVNVNVAVGAQFVDKPRDESPEEFMRRYGIATMDEHGDRRGPPKPELKPAKASTPGGRLLS